MSAPANIANHPIHPMLVVFPIGLWIFSLVSDLIWVTGLGTTLWNDLAFYTMAGGLIGAVLAAIPGVMDFLSIPRRSRIWKLALYHMIVNLLATAMFAVNLYLRSSQASPAPFPIALSILGILLLVIGGWLGGEMVYVLGMGVHPGSPPVKTEDQKHRAKIRRLG